MKLINGLLRRFGVILVPVPPSGKMLIEHANVCESQHIRADVHGGTDSCVRWARRVAEIAGYRRGN